MGFVGKAVKLGVIAKLAQVAQRELSKPQNRQKLQAALDSIKSRAGSGGGGRLGT